MKKPVELERRGQTRRKFLERSTLLGSALTLGGWTAGGAAELGAAAPGVRDYKISLAAWSLHRALFSNLLKMVDLPRVCRQSFGVDGLELVNVFFPSPNSRYLAALSRAADDHGVKILLIMVDGEGALGHSDTAERKRAVRNHFKWVDIAQRLGCHAIRVNMHIDDEATAWNGSAFRPEALERITDSFRGLIEYAEPAGISVIIENHGGVSSNADALVQVMKAVDSPSFGTLPDFGNFPESADKYESVRKMMPYAKAVSAKCHDFGPDGQETRLDYERLIRIVVDEAGYHGYIGIEYEGDRMTEYSGVVACKALLDGLRTKSA